MNKTPALQMQSATVIVSPIMTLEYLAVDETLPDLTPSPTPLRHRTSPVSNQRTMTGLETEASQ